MQASINNTGSQNKTPRPSLFGVPVRRESANFALGGAYTEGGDMGSPEYESFHRTGRQYQPVDYSQTPFPAVGVSILIAIGLVAGLHWLVSQCAR